MQQLNNKSTGEEVTADEWNVQPSELQNAITSSGQALSGADLTQLAQAITRYASVGTFYADASVAANTVVVNSNAGYIAPSALIDGQTIRFRALFTNTGEVTLSVNGGTALALNGPTGDALAPGQITAGAMVTCEYHQSSATFRLTGTGALARQTAIIRTPQVFSEGASQDITGLTFTVAPQSIYKIDMTLVFSMGTAPTSPSSSAYLSFASTPIAGTLTTDVLAMVQGNDDTPNGSISSAANSNILSLGQPSVTLIDNVARVQGTLVTTLNSNLIIRMNVPTGGEYTVENITVATLDYIGPRDL